MKTNVSEGVERKPVLAPLAPLELLKGHSGSQRKYSSFVVYFRHWKHFLPPGCSNSHLLTAFHAGLQLTPGRFCTKVPL